MQLSESRLFVNFLPRIKADKLDSEVRHVFGQHGKCTVSMPTNTYGIVKGFGFVEYETPASAESAFQAMNGKALDLTGWPPHLKMRIQFAEMRREAVRSKGKAVRGAERAAATDSPREAPKRR